MNRTLTGTLFVLLSAAGYAFFPIFSKMATGAGVQPFDLAVWRFVLASAMLWLAFPLWRKQSRLQALTRADYLNLLMLGAIFTTGALTAFVALNSPLTASAFTLLINTSPAMIAVLSFALGERLPLASWLAVALATVGIGLILEGELVVDSWSVLAWPLINAAIIAVYMVIAQRKTKHLPGLTAGIGVINGACLTLLVIGIFHGINIPRGPEAWLPVLGIAFFGTVIGIAALLVGMRYLGAARASLISSAGPPATLVFASLILGERLGVLQYVGGALVLGSVLLVNLGNPRHEPVEVIT